MKTNLTWILLFALMIAFAACWNVSYSIPPARGISPDDGEPAASEPITSVVIGISAPAKGANPSTTAAYTGNFVVNDVLWLPPDNPFLGGVPYSVILSLMADTGYTFTDMDFVAINGISGTVLSNIGGAVTLSCTFTPTNVNTVTTMEIIGAPTKMIYTHGYPLDLRGLLVRLTYDDGTDEEIAYNSFISKNITTEPAPNFLLDSAVHDGMPITITCGGVSITTPQNLTVSPPSQGETGPLFLTVSFDLNGGHLPSGRTEVPSQRISEGSTIPRPLNSPVKLVDLWETSESPSAGLYSTTNGILHYTFSGWFCNDTEWEFDYDVLWSSDVTLVAHYGSPTAEPVGALVTNNGFPAAAFNYVNTPTKAGEYTLILPGGTTYTYSGLATTNTATTVASTPSALPTLTQQNVDLHIRSNGSAVTFQKPATAKGVLLHVGTSNTAAIAEGSSSNVCVTLGDNIILQGAANDRPVAVISGGATLVMEGNSKITGNTNSSSNSSFRTFDTGANGSSFLSAGAAVCVYGGTLIMRGDSIITGNSTGANGWYGFKAGGVFVYRWGTLIMEGSASVKGNNSADTKSSDVLVDRENNGNRPGVRGTIIMGGGSFIERLALCDYGGNWNDNTTFVTIASAMTTPVDIKINLWREENSTGTNGNFWQANTPLLRAAAGYALTPADVAKFKLNARTGWDNNVKEPTGTINLSSTTTGTNLAGEFGRLSVKN